MSNRTVNSGITATFDSILASKRDTPAFLSKSTDLAITRGSIDGPGGNRQEAIHPRNHMAICTIPD